MKGDEVIRSVDKYVFTKDANEHDIFKLFISGHKREAVVGETVENVQICFTVRYCRKIADISSTKYRIIFNDELYDIVSVDHFSYTKKYLKFKCRKVRR